MIEFYLKILSGNHIGAEIPLEPGRYSLGKDENCDLVLTDATLNEIELIVEISESGQLKVQTSTAEEQIYLNGQPVGSATQCNAFDILTSSGLFFALGPSDENWPDLHLPQIQRIEQEDPEEAEPGDAENSESDFPDTDEDNTDILPTEDANETPAEELDDDDYEYEDDSESLFANIDRKWLIAIPATIGIVFLILMMVMLSGPSEDIEQKLSSLEQVRHIRQNLKLNDVRLKELPDKAILLTGYTLTSKKKRELQKQLRERGIPFNSQIVSMNELRANADAILKSRGYKNLILELDTTPGSLVLTGYVATSEQLEQIVTTLKQEMHGLISVVDQVENQAGRVNTLKSMLRDKGLSTRINLIIRPGKIKLEGHLLDDGQVYNLQEVVTQFRRRFGKIPAVIIATKSAGSNQSTQLNQSSSPSLNIRGISMGRVPYITMEDGSKYLIGAKLANGYIIEDINLEYLLLSNGTERIKYRLGGNRDGHTEKR